MNDMEVLGFIVLKVDLYKIVFCKTGHKLTLPMGLKTPVLLPLFKGRQGEDAQGTRLLRAQRQASNVMIKILFLGVSRVKTKSNHCQQCNDRFF